MPVAIAVETASGNAAAAEARAEAAERRMKELEERLREQEKKVVELSATVETREKELLHLQGALEKAEAEAQDRERLAKEFAVAEARGQDNERLAKELAAAQAAAQAAESTAQAAQAAQAEARAAAVRPATVDASTQFPENAPKSAEAVPEEVPEKAPEEKAPEKAPEVAQKPQPATKRAMEPNKETVKKLQAATDSLDKDKQKALQNVLAKKQVELDTKNHSLNFKKAVEFEPRHHGKSNSAVFKDEKVAMAILRDAATLLGVYDTARVVVEGHTATPDAKLDDWAHELADNRANRVRNALVDLGVDAKRLEAVGKPGKHGIGHTEVLLKIAEL